MAILFPAGRGISPRVTATGDFDKTVRRAPCPSRQDIRLAHFAGRKDEILSHFLVSQRDVLTIVDVANQVKEQERELPNILEIGAGTLLLSFLLAETTRARVLALEPSSVAVSCSSYRHPNMQVLEADAQWALDNFSGEPASELDLVVWAWPTLSAKPFEVLNQLGVKSVLLIFDLDDGGYQGSISSSNGQQHYYTLNFDQVPGYAKRALWQRFSRQDLSGVESPRARFFQQRNLFVLYTREGEQTRIVPPELVKTTEYPWVQELERLVEERSGNLGMLNSFRMIDSSYEICPRWTDDDY